MRLSIVSVGAEPGSRFLDRLKLAELLGFHAVFHADKRWGRDLFSRLGAAIQCTTRLGLGIGGIDPFTRHPALLAQAAATLAEMAPGRFRLVLTARSDLATLPGYASAHPASALRETAELIRRLWSGERVTLNGEAVRFKDGALDWKPTTLPPLYFAGRGPHLLTLAGRSGDGVVIEDFTTPPGIAYAKEHIAAGLQATKRDWPALRLCVGLRMAVLDREDDALPDAVRDIACEVFWANRPTLGGMIDKLCYDATREFRDFVRDAPPEQTPQAMEKLRRLVPRGIVDSLTLAGTAPHVVARLKALAGAGVQEVIMSPVLAKGQDTEDFMFKLAKDVLPHFSERPTRAA